MEILKDGTIEDRWVGQCIECNAVIMAEKSEFPSDEQPTSKETYRGDCIFCNQNRSVMFEHLRSTRAKQLLRKNKLET